MLVRRLVVFPPSLADQTLAVRTIITICRVKTTLTIPTIITICAVGTN